MQSLQWRRLDRRRIDNKLSLMYNITQNVIAIPISDFLIPLVRPSRHYHPLSYMLITATTDYYTFPFFPRAVFYWNNLWFTYYHTCAMYQVTRLILTCIFERNFELTRLRFGSYVGTAAVLHKTVYPQRLVLLTYCLV